jgi:hypothetical protein
VDAATRAVADPAPGADTLPTVPDRHNRAPVALTQAIVSAPWRNIGLALSVGLVAALMAVALPLTTPVWRQWSLVLLGGLFAALIGRYNELSAAEQSPLALCACVANHFGSVVIVASVTAFVARCRWPLSPFWRTPSAQR